MTADAGIVAYGADMGEAFANAACGMFSLMADLEQVAEATSRHVEVEAGDRESLVVAWLNELLYLFDVERIVFRRFDILELTNTRLEGRGSWRGGGRLAPQAEERSQGRDLPHAQGVGRRGPLQRSRDLRRVEEVGAWHAGMDRSRRSTTIAGRSPGATSRACGSRGSSTPARTCWSSIRQDQAPEQVANVAFLPGIVGHSWPCPTSTGATASPSAGWRPPAWRTA